MTVKTKRRILIVEDESIVAFAIKETHKNADYDVPMSIDIGRSCS
jgi:hypothetical protein|tara:strand:+ start:42 stop:176 length:135 start_codon:yes stop_codon:yes gene_type:complete